MLKRVRRIAQLSPFVYAFAYIIILILYNFASDTTLDVLDDLFYISPVVIVINLVYSRILKFCKWHKVACVLPLFPELVNLAEPFIVVLYQDQTIVLNSVLAALSILFVISAYKVFFCDGR